MSPIGAFQCIYDVVSFANSVGHLYAVIVKSIQPYRKTDNKAMKKRGKYPPGILGLRTRGSSESAILIFGCVLACALSGVNKVTYDFGADINSELARKNRDISVKLVLTFCSSSEIFNPGSHTVMSSV